MNSGLRIGATVSFENDPRNRIAQLEERGVESFWMYEIFRGYEAFARAGYLAAITSKAEISVGVINSYSRHPAIVAMGASFLANITGGRAALLIGVGSDSWVGGLLGYRQNKPLQRFREYVRLLRRMLSGDEVDYRSVNFSLNKVRIKPTPDYPVSIMAACEQPAMMKLAGKLTDGVFLEPACCSIGYVRWAVQATGGSDNQTREFRVIANLPLRITENVEEALASIKPMLAFHVSFPGEGELYMEKAGFSSSLAEKIGNASGVRQLLKEKRSPLEAFGTGMIEKAAAMIPDDFANQCSVIGGIDACRDRLKELQRAGLTDIVFSFQEDHKPDLAILHRTPD